MTDGRHAARRDAAIKLTKAVHTLAWFSIESCVFYLLYAGFTGRSDRRAAIAAGVVAGESLVFAASGFRCPLTVMAERLGADHGSVTDVCLPDWLAHRLPAIHVPLLLLAGYLHAMARRRRRQRFADGSALPGGAPLRREKGDVAELLNFEDRVRALNLSGFLPLGL
jgi:hypothetical protein